MSTARIDSIDLQIKSSVESSIESLDKLIARIEKATEGLDKISEATKNINSSSKKVGAEGSKGMDSFTRATERSEKAMSKLNTVINATVLVKITRTLIKVAGEGFAEMSSYVENYNLFLVSMREHLNEAIKFQNQLNNAWGTNISQSMKYQGFYMNLTTALGVARDASYELSEALTLMTYDMSSLFNWTPDVAYQRLQAGIVGQTKPLRYAGIDVTQQTIQPILDELGIEKYVTHLTQAEKVLLRSISIWRQTANVQGDYARTIETAANQQKIFLEQAREMTRWFGGIFMGVIKNLLPYLNAVVMVLKEIFKYISLLLGFTMADMGVSNLEDLSSGFSMVGEEADNAADSVRALMGIRGFDELNNISSPSSGGGNLGGASSSMIKLQDELNRMMEEYKDNMKIVEYSAYGIRDRIMETLGFMKSINEETGEVSFTFVGLRSPALTKLNESLKNLTSSVINLATAVWDRLKMVWDNVIIPIGAFTITEVLPDFFDLLTAVIDFFALILEESEPIFEWFLKDFVTPLSLFTLNVVRIGLEKLTDAVNKFASFLKENQWAMDLFFGAMVGIGIFLGGKTFFTGITALWLMTAAIVGMQLPALLLHAKVGLLVGVLVILGTVAVKAIRAWDDMSGLGKAVTAFGLLAIAATAGAIAVGAFQSAWTIGLGAAAIVAGIAAITWAINDATKRANAAPNLNLPSGRASNTSSSSRTNYAGGNISMMADGGFATTGQMFIAREAGAELVGTIGNKTAVMNNEQIVSSVSRGVASAVSAVMGSRDGGETKATLVVDDVALGTVSIKAINKAQRLTGVTIQ